MHEDDKDHNDSSAAMMIVLREKHSSHKIFISRDAVQWCST